jgi:outer membrane immunogenic protein
MKKLLVGSVGLASIVAANAAVAADMPVKAIKAAPLLVDPWNGFYVGINVGAGIGRNHTTDTTTNPAIPFPVFDNADFNHSPAGAIFGLQAGWNWHALPQWVLGVEADWQWSGQSESVCTYACLPGSTPPALLSVIDEQSLKWFGTVRGRAGFLTQGGSLLYATGGLAWGRVNRTLTLNATPGFFAAGTTSAASFGDNKIGWTIGAGVEAPLWRNLSVKVEYLYIDLGTATHSFDSALDPAAALGPSQTTTTTSRIHDHVVRVGLNYHFDDGSPTPAGAPAMFTKAPFTKAPPATMNWTGFYAGGNAGVAIARNPTLDTFRLGPPGLPGFPDAGDDSYHQVPYGGMFGAQLGFNWRLAPDWLIGAEADWQWTNQTSNACISECLPTGFQGIPFILPGVLLGQTDSQTIKGLGTLRGRFGWIAPNNSLWYVTGGAAWGRIEDATALLATPAVIAAGAQSSASFSHTKSGWTIGAGAEVPLWDHWSVKAEYLYIDLGSITDSFTSALDTTQLPATSLTTATSFKIRDHIARFGLNYHFN